MAFEPKTSEALHWYRRGHRFRPEFFSGGGLGEILKTFLEKELGKKHSKRLSRPGL